MTLDDLMARHRRIQDVVVSLSRGRITEDTARNDMQRAGLSAAEVERLLVAVRKNLIIAGVS
jgi:hypothetical protein